MIKGCQHFNLKPWQLEVVICMFAWQCDRVISGDNAHSIHSGTAIPKYMKYTWRKRIISISVAAEIIRKKPNYFFPLGEWKVKKPNSAPFKFIFWFNIFKYWTQQQLPGTSSGSKNTPQALPFPVGWIPLSSHMNKVPLENVSYYWCNFLLKWWPEDTWRQNQVIE